jgi:sarcosine oxidase gamma subunit
MPDTSAGFAIASDDDFQLFELAAWSRSQLDDILTRQGLPCPRRQGEAAAAESRIVLRITPRLAWVIGRPGVAPNWQPGQDGVAVDLSNSRVRLRLRHGARQLLPRLVAVDLGDGLPPGAFVASMIHGVPVTILHAENGVDLLVPRTFHASLLEWIEDAGRDCQGRPIEPAPLDQDQISPGELPLEQGSLDRDKLLSRTNRLER